MVGQLSTNIRDEENSLNLAAPLSALPGVLDYQRLRMWSLAKCSTFFVLQVLEQGSLPRLILLIGA